jgi:hypothetical protein
VRRFWQLWRCLANGAVLSLVLAMPRDAALREADLDGEARAHASSSSSPSSDFERRILRNQFVASAASVAAEGVQGSAPSCSRLLLLTNDLYGQGLGWSMRFYVYALLAAMESGRVLVELSSTSLGHHSEIRWCGRPPFTLECYFRRWSDCVPPENASALPLTSPRRKHHWGSLGLTTVPAPTLRVTLSQFNPEFAFPPHQSRDLTNRSGAHAIPRPSWTRASAAAIRFLLRPRSWVRGIGTCVLRCAHSSNESLYEQSLYAASDAASDASSDASSDADLDASSDVALDDYVGVFVRDSVEKAHELGARACLLELRRMCRLLWWLCGG